MASLTTAIIIPYMRADEAREQNIKLVVAHYQKMMSDTTEIIIVEHIFDTPQPVIVKHQLARSFEGMFNKGKLLNMGAADTTAHCLIFADADILLPEPAFTLLCTKLETSGEPTAIQPFTRVIDLTREQTTDFIQNRRPLTQVRGDDREGIVFAGGIVGMNRQAFDLVGGWDEGYEGWGVEDNAMAYKLLRKCHTDTIEARAVHLAHPRIDESYLHTAAYRRNLKRFRKLIRS